MHLTILSPHRDDAAFSLSMSLSRWTGRKIQLRVVNFFTRSEYAPYTPSACKSAVASIRKREDLTVLSNIDKQILVKAHDLLDAPLRFGIPAEAVCRHEVGLLQERDERDRLRAYVRQYFVRGFVIAPLGLGGHVDHLAINQAAIASSRPGRLGFYEDLPYATWTTEASLRERVLEIERALCTILSPAVIRTNGCAVSRKVRTIRRYRSQISREEAVAIARYSLKYNRGERIWTPKHNRAWQDLLQ